MQTRRVVYEVQCAACVFCFSSRRRHTRCLSDWSSDVCSSDLPGTDRAASEFPAKGAGNSWQSCLSPGRPVLLALGGPAFDFVLGGEERQSEGRLSERIEGALKFQNGADLGPVGKWGIELQDDLFGGGIADAEHEFGGPAGWGGAEQCPLKARGKRGVVQRCREISIAIGRFQAPADAQPGCQLRIGAGEFLVLLAH